MPLPLPPQPAPQPQNRKALILAGMLQNAFGSPQSQQSFSDIIRSILMSQQQEQFDERRFAREDVRFERTAAAENARLNTTLGLPPNATQEDRSRAIAQQKAGEQFTAAGEFAGGIEGIPQLRQTLQTFPEGHPRRQAISARLASLGAEEDFPEAPPIGAEFTTGGGSVTPIARFKQLKDIQARTDLAKISATATAGRPTPEQAGATAEAVRAATLRADEAAGVGQAGGKPTEKQVIAGLVSASGIEANTNAMQIESTIGGDVFQTFGGVFTAQGQAYAQAKDAYFELIRTLSGAAINEAEEVRQARRFFAVIGNKVSTIKLKQRDRTQHLINQIIISGQVAKDLGISPDDVILAIGDIEGGFDSLTDEQVERWIELRGGQ